jgi:hypothetical protein
VEAGFAQNEPKKKKLYHSPISRHKINIYLGICCYSGRMTKVTQTALNYDGTEFLLEQWDETSRLILPSSEAGRGLAEKLHELMRTTFREQAQETSDGKHIFIDIVGGDTPREQIGVKHAIATPKLVLEALEQWVVEHYVEKVTQRVPHACAIGRLVGDKRWKDPLPADILPAEQAKAKEAWSFRESLRGSVQTPSPYGHTRADFGSLDGISHQVRQRTEFVADAKSDNRKIHEFALRLKLERDVGTITR